MDPIQDTLFICLKSLPENTPKGALLYVAGNFNNWQAGDAAYSFFEGEDTLLHAAIRRTDWATMVEFKINRGTWETVECDEWGNEIPNHRIDFPSWGACFVTDVLSWKDIPQADFKQINPQVTIYYNQMYIPQLDRMREVIVYLPPDYRQSPDNHYPVLYMQDGQNLFAHISGGKGTWEVDATLDYLCYQTGQRFIVVGIANGEENRLNEYAPWKNPEYGGGEGGQYAEFLVKTLKPAIDQSFRTQTKSKATALIGSSMGGLISLYTALSYPDVFGKVGILSPSLWFTDDIFAFTQSQPLHEANKFLLMGSRQESKSMLSDLVAIYTLLKEKGLSSQNLMLNQHQDGEHSEWFWAREFLQIVGFLFEIPIPEEAKRPQSEDISISIENQTLIIQNTVSEGGWELFNSEGKRLTSQRLYLGANHYQLCVPVLKNYLVKLYDKQALFYFEVVGL